MPNYTLTDADRQEFTDWWDDNHCEGDTSRQNGESEYFWAKDSFEYGVKYAVGINLLGSTDRDSDEETIAGLTRQAVLLQEKIDTLTSENNELHELLEENIPDNLLKDLVRQEDEIDTLKITTSNYKDVIKLLVEMI